MVRMLLVDDEVRVLEGIQSVFALRDLGFELVGTFTNPKTALASLESLRPDVIVTDIKMPAMNGLEFSEQAIDCLPDVQIVILSGFDDFEFAQTAIRIGVVDYLLKPVKRLDFEAMLSKVRARITEKAQQRSSVGAVDRQEVSAADDRIGRWLLSLTEAGVDPLAADQRHDEWGLGFRSFPYRLLKLMIRKAPGGLTFGTFAGCVQTFFPSELQPYGEVLPFHSSDQVYLLVTRLQGEARTMKDRVLSAARLFDAQYGISCTIALSAIHTGLQDLAAAAVECDTALTAAFLSDLSVAEAEEPGTAASEAHWTGGEFEALLQAVSRGEGERVNELLDDLFQPSSPGVSVDYYYSVALILLVRLSAFQGEEGTIPFLKKTCRTVTALKDFVRNRIQTQMAANQTGKLASSGKIVQSVILYIGEHLTEEISLADIAQSVNVTKNYLCSVFKKETGTTLLNYLVETRIRKAKKLLKGGGLKMYEIAEMVGYRDYAYFSQIFKRQTGVTLSEYRNSV